MKITWKVMADFLAVGLPGQVLSQNNEQPPGIIAAAAANVSFPLSVEAVGTASANEAVDIRPEVSAAITAIRFEEGQQVSAGDVLVELERSKPLAELAAAKARLVDSDSQYRRSEELFKTQAVAVSQLEQLKARRDADQAAVEAAEALVNDTVIRAPFDGVLGLRRVSLGSIVDTDTVITTLDDTRQIKVDFDVAERDLSRVQSGLKFTATSVSWPNEVFEGEVLSVATRVDPVTRTVTVRGRMPNDEGRLRPGMFMNVKLMEEDTLALVIPEQSLVPERSRQYVYRIHQQNAETWAVEKVEVQIGRRRPGQVEVISGLNPGDVVIAEGTQKAAEGSTVRVVEQMVVEG